MSAQAQDMVTVGEVLPALQGSPEADIVVAPSPSPGTARVVRRRDIKRALLEHGVVLDGIRIPRQVRVRRGAREVVEAELKPLVVDAVENVIGSCRLESIRLPRRLRIATGDLTVEAEPPARLRDGSVSVVTTVTAGGQSQRLLVASRLRCPPPVVRAGAPVRLVVRVGAVRASAPGRSRQAGRVGDVIRVVNTATGSRVSARVVDADTVEIMR